MERHNLINHNVFSHQFITDQELSDVLVYLRFHAGEITYGEGIRTIKGYLAARGIFVSERRIMMTMRNIDTDGVVYRTRMRLERGTYSCLGPMEMFHADANCKLCHWRIYFHGCIDGFSHYIVYCNVAGKNDSATVAPFFEAGCAKVGDYPFHLRTDRGWENRGMWQAMAYNRGRDYLKCVFVGPSTRNVRIERLWLTLGNHKIMKWRRRFLDMEKHHGLDRHNNLHLYCLHRVFLPRIDYELQIWVEAQNNKPHESDPMVQSRRSPKQRFQEGLLEFNDEFRTEMLRRAGEGLDPNRNYQNDGSDPDTGYGAIDRESRWLESDAHQHAWATVPPPPLSQQQMTILNRHIRSMLSVDDGMDGIAQWVALKNILEGVLQAQDY